MIAVIAGGRTRADAYREAMLRAPRLLLMLAAIAPLAAEDERGPRLDELPAPAQDAARRLIGAGTAVEVTSSSASGQRRYRIAWSDHANHRHTIEVTAGGTVIESPERSRGERR